ncbi:hypothetical protein BGX38DRAFT_54466 [Terfezia claveryi]|nr:hypothetical protein BGX38DRAFT_54466 [Terfezia claveryi]
MKVPTLSFLDDDEEEVDGSDDEQGEYINEEEAVQYAKITLGGDRVTRYQLCHYRCLSQKFFIRQYLVYKLVSVMTILQKKEKERSESVRTNVHRIVYFPQHISYSRSIPIAYPPYTASYWRVLSYTLLLSGPRDFTKDNDAEGFTYLMRRIAYARCSTFKREQ